jgi:hypothetical protein
VAQERADREQDRSAHEQRRREYRQVFHERCPLSGTRRKGSSFSLAVPVPASGLIRAGSPLPLIALCRTAAEATPGGVCPARPGYVAKPRIWPIADKGRASGKRHIVLRIHRPREPVQPAHEPAPTSPRNSTLPVIRCGRDRVT